MNSDKNHNVVKKLLESFTPTNNLRRNYEKEKEIIMEEKASLQIQMMLRTPIMNNFLQQRKGGQIIGHLPLKPPVEVPHDNNGRPVRFERFSVTSKENKASINQTSKFVIYPDNYRPFLFEVSTLINEQKTYKNRANIELNNRSIFDLFRPLTAYNTAEKVCAFFGNEPFSYAPYKLKSGTTWNDNFTYHWHNQPLTPQDGVPEERLLDHFTKSYIYERSRDFELNVSLEKCYSGNLKFLHSFESPEGLINQKVMTCYDWKSGYKILVPVTTWATKGISLNREYCVPLPDKQPLFGLKELALRPESDVILTDSIELVSLNQSKYRTGLVWSSFLPGVDSLQYIDWSPLKGRKVFYLLTNHSGISAEQQYLNAKKIKDYLSDDHGIELQFVQAIVDYPEPAGLTYEYISEYQAYRLKYPPKLIEASVQLIDSETFSEMVKKAYIRLHAETDKFWKESKKAIEDKSASPVIKETDRSLPVDYLIRPVIVKGGLVFFIGMSGVAKTPFLISLVAAFINNARVIYNKWWTISRSVDTPQKDRPQHKALYFNYENAIDIEGTDKNLVTPYFKGNPTKNFIVKNVSTSEWNLSNESNHQKVLDFIEEVNSMDDNRLPVELIVIDTYTQMIGGVEKGESSWPKVQPLIDKIRAMGIAVVITHHLKGKDNTPYGANTKLHDASRVLLTRESDNCASIEVDPMTVKIERIKHGRIAKDKEPFNILFDSKKGWVCVDDGFIDTDSTGKRTYHDSAENSELRTIVDGYKRQGCSRDQITAFIGMGKSAYSDRIKQ